MSITTSCTSVETVLWHGKTCSADCTGKIGLARILLLPEVMTAVSLVLYPVVVVLIPLGEVVAGSECS